MRKLVWFALVVAASANAQYYNQTIIPIADGIGTSGAAIPLMNGANTWSALQTFTLGMVESGAAASINDNSNFNTTINTGTSTGTVTLGQNTATPGAVVIKGPVSFQAGTSFSGASWTTVSPVFNGAAMTLNDTTAGSGGVVTEAAYTLQAPNFTNTQGTANVLTNGVTLWIAPPTCSTGASNWSSCTNLYTLYANGKAFFNGATSIGGVFTQNTGATNINVSSNNAVNIGTGSTNALVSIGGGSDGVAINSGLSTGFVKDTALISTGTKFTVAGTGACGTITTTLGGASAGSFLCTGTAGASTATITINGASGLAAPTGWACSGGDVTSGVAWGPSGAASTTTGTISGVIGVTSDRVVFHCIGY